MLLGGAAVNALAFSGSNYMFSLLRGIAEERKWHDKAVEELQAAQAEWSKARTERLDWINEELRRQGHAVQTFHDVDMAIHEYAQVTGHKLNSLGSEPQLADFYMPNGDQKNSEITFVVAGMATTDLVAYMLTKWSCRSPNFFLLQRYIVKMGLPEELYYAMHEVGHCAHCHKIPSPLAHTMIDIVQMSLEL